MKRIWLDVLTSTEREDFKAMVGKRTRIRNAIKHVRGLRDGYGPAHEADFDDAITSGLRAESKLDGAIKACEGMARLRYEMREQ